ncbi:NAD(+)/NADH kinase [Candidatus Dojkabacteria bacterium]|jgi:NAD+ kinase|nr:NAD(+)/NADH kinase [Candidatus Dojkabacteria bacterium]
MRIKYLKNEKYPKAQEFNLFIERVFPQLLEEKKPELYLVAGGDGSMLHSIQANIDSKIPFFGKAYGTVNFLLNEFKNDQETIQNILDDKIKLDIFETYAISAYLDGKKLGEAVNDVILGDEIMSNHYFTLSTKSGDFLNFEFRGSGLCISTPIGSTAFNYNNNGRILPLDSDLLSITGVVCNKQINDIIHFEKVSIKSNGVRVYLTNVKSKILKEGSELILKKGSKIRIAFLNKKDFLQKRIELGHRFRK